MSETVTHAELMDSTYKFQRLIYDATRRYYLLGRDHLVEELKPPNRGTVLEIACGTGRNLAKIGKAYPNSGLYGLDISSEMLKSAEAKLNGRASLVQADACNFDAKSLFGQNGFDRVVLSYSLSMIPDWTGALRMAVSQLNAGGELHIVDFSNQTGLPGQFRTLLHAWLKQFHVQPRIDMKAVVDAIAQEEGLTVRFVPLYRDYAQYCALIRPE